MTIKTIIAGVEGCAFKPPGMGTAGVCKNFIPSFFPEYLFSSTPPECLRISN
jgi:hypothetical protein